MDTTFEAMRDASFENNLLNHCHSYSEAHVLDRSAHSSKDPTTDRDAGAEIRHHDHLYYVSNRPEISDEAYDALFQELTRLENAHPDLVTPDSPTQRVGGAPQTGLKKFQHERPMLSLDSITVADDIRAFDKRVRREVGRELDRDLSQEIVHYTVEPKFDGLSSSWSTSTADS